MSVLVRVWSVERLEFVEQSVDDVDEEHEVHLHVQQQLERSHKHDSFNSTCRHYLIIYTVNYAVNLRSSIS